MDIKILIQYLENLQTNALFGQTIDRWKEMDDVLKLGIGQTGFLSKDHKLKKEFKNKNKESIKKSWIEERVTLLQEIVDLPKEKRFKKISKKESKVSPLERQSWSTIKKDKKK